MPRSYVRVRLNLKPVPVSFWIEDQTPFFSSSSTTRCLPKETIGNIFVLIYSNEKFWIEIKNLQGQPNSVPSRGNSLRVSHLMCCCCCFFGCRSAPTESSTNNPSKRSSSNSSRKEVRANDRERNGRVACGRAITLGRRLRRRKHHHIRTSFAIQISTPSLGLDWQLITRIDWGFPPGASIHRSFSSFYFCPAHQDRSLLYIYPQPTHAIRPSYRSTMKLVVLLRDSVCPPFQHLFLA